MEKFSFSIFFYILWSFRYFLVERHEFEDGKCSQTARFSSEILSNIEPNTWKNSKFSKTVFSHHLNLCKVYVYAIPIWSVKYNYTKKIKNFFCSLDIFALSDFHSKSIEILPLFRWKLTKIDKFLWGFWIFRKFIQLWRAVSPSSMNIFWWDRYHCKDLCLNFTTSLIRAKTGTWRKSYVRYKIYDFRKWTFTSGYTPRRMTIGVMVAGETSNALVHRIAPPRGLNGYLGCVGAYILDSSWPKVFWDFAFFCEISTVSWKLL